MQVLFPDEVHARAFSHEVNKLLEFGFDELAWRLLGYFVHHAVTLGVTHGRLGVEDVD